MQKSMITLSSRATLHLLDNIGTDHDAPVLSWMHSLIPRIDKSEEQVRGYSIMHENINYALKIQDLCRVNLSLDFDDDDIMDCEPSFCSVTENCVLEDTFSSFSSANCNPILASTPLRPLPDAAHDDSMDQSSLNSSSFPSLEMSLISNEASTHTLILTPSGAPEQSLFHSPNCTQAVLSTTPIVSPESPSEWNGFKLVGDNIDKTVRRRHQRLGCTTQSLHYFNSFAVKDRVDLSSFDENRPDVAVEDLSAELLLPSDKDLQQLLSNFEVLIGRILTKHLPALHCLAGAVVEHIKHPYYVEMSKKSEVVSC